MVDFIKEQGVDEKYRSEPEPDDNADILFARDDNRPYIHENTERGDEYQNYFDCGFQLSYPSELSVSILICLAYAAAVISVADDNRIDRDILHFVEQ